MPAPATRDDYMAALLNGEEAPHPDDMATLAAVRESIQQRAKIEADRRSCEKTMRDLDVRRERAIGAVEALADLLWGREVERRSPSEPTDPAQSSG